MRESCPLCGRPRRSPSETVPADLLSDLRLELPKSRPYPDEFYQRVADKVRLAAAAKLGVTSGAIAKANNVPATTGHRWVREARARGFLNPARHGSYAP